MAGPEYKPQTPMGGVKAFSCRNCGGQIKLRAPGQTLTAACDHCQAVTDLTDDNFRVISEYHSGLTWKPVIPLGSRGELEGVQWEVIGFMVRNAVGYEYYWEEYLLFNPYHGFRFLVHNARHWSIVEPLIEHPELSPGSVYVNFDGQKYKRFVAGQAKVMFVLGEFYWKVHFGDTAQTIDYIAPPYMLSGEVEQGGVVWSRGLYLTHQQVSTAFQLEQPLPLGTGIGPNQPNPFKANARFLLITAILATVLACVLQFATQGKSQDLLSTKIIRTIATDSVGGAKYITDTLVSPIFVVPGTVGNIEVVAQAAGLSNSWVEIEGYLHNVETLDNYSVEIGFEYYAGFEDGESWSEGSIDGDVFINEVPGGRYELVLNVAGENLSPVQVNVRRNVPFFSNLLFLIGLIWIIPAYYLIRSLTFESIRWKEGD
jgi:hypothetical protein